METCIGVYVRKYAEGKKLDLDKFSLTVDAEFSKQAPICFKQIDVDIDLGGLEPDKDKKEVLSRFVKNCPIHNTLKSNPSIEIEIQS